MKILSRISIILFAFVLMLSLCFNAAALEKDASVSDSNTVLSESEVTGEDSPVPSETEIDETDIPDYDSDEYNGDELSFETESQVNSITTDKKQYEGIVGESFTIHATAPGKISFRSSDKSIATVSSSGLVKLLKTGTVYITVRSAATSKCAAQTLKKTVRSYPKTLTAPTLKIKTYYKTRIALQWNKVRNAAEYWLIKKNVATGKYYIVKKFDKSVNETTITRNMGRYAIRAVRYVNGKKINNPEMKTIYIPGLAGIAKTYKSIKNIRTYTPDNGTLKQLAMIRGESGTTVPQSLSFTGKEYVVSYVNLDGDKGRLISYDRTGKLKRTGPLISNRIGHANGATYNPNDKAIYTVKTHTNIKSSECTVLSPDTFKVTKSFNLPKTASGIAYDESTDQYYVSKGNEIYILSGSFKYKKTITKLRYNHAQDIGAYNGVVLVCTWVSGKTSYVDLYRASNGNYLGSYSFCFNEIESVIVDDGYLVIIMNHAGDNKDFLYKTTNRITLNT